MKNLTIISFLFFTAISCQSQKGENIYGHSVDAAFDKEVRNYLDFLVPTIDVDSLKAIKKEVYLLDARELEEYLVSHIPGAVHIGYEKPNFLTVEKWNKNKPVVVYCSIGYRSEKIAKKLKDKGFTEVYNLYGSIFEWANRGNPIVDSRTQPTQKIHTYNRKWSKWVLNEDLEKMW